MYFSLVLQKKMRTQVFIELCNNTIIIGLQVLFEKFFFRSDYNTNTYFKTPNLIESKIQISPLTLDTVNHLNIIFKSLTPHASIIFFRSDYYLPILYER